MLALVEPFAIGSLPDRPNLGCSMLVGAIQARGQDVRLVLGQSRWLRDLLLTDQQEFIELVTGLDDKTRDFLKLTALRERIGDLGADGFATSMSELYHRFFTNRTPRAYLDSLQLSRMVELSRAAMRTYAYYCRSHPERSLSIVDRYVGEIRAIDPDYVGFSLVRPRNPILSRVFEKTRQELDVPVIFGGWITPYLTDAERRDLLSASPRDCLVAGLADNSLPDLIEVLDRGGDPLEVPGVFQLRDDRIEGRPAASQPSLDEVPFPDFSQYDLNAFALPTLVLPMQTARGCSWRKCTFCSHIAIYQGKYQREDVSRVVDTIEHLRERYGCRQVVFHDEELPAKRADLLSDAILERGLEDVYLYTYARLVKQFEKPERLDKMYRAGFRTLVWGMESGNQRVLDLMEKGTEPKQMGRILKLAADHGFGNLCFVMFGFPGETEAEAQETADFLEEHAQSIAITIYGVFEMEPGTPVANDPGKWGVTVSEGGDWTAPSDGMSREQATRFLNAFTGKERLGLNRINKFSYFIRENISRMMLFVCFTNGITAFDECQEVLADEPAEELFPLLMGQVRSGADGKVLVPVDTSKSHIYHQIQADSPIELDELSAKIHELADGTRSWHEIMAQAGAGDDSTSRATDFLLLNLQRGNGYLFRRRWTYRAEPASDAAISATGREVSVRSSQVAPPS
jgi:radical SAM superfamily enzyme YgiQ (UPF0313 family)